MSTTLYASATEHINKHPYDVMVQAHFSGIHTEVEKGIFKSPIYEPFDHTIKQRSKIPIAKMVELFVSKSSFIITEDKDVLSILHYIDAYVEEVYHMRTDTEIEKYLEKILKLRDRIYFLFRRVLNLHPQWKNAYEGQIGVFQIISQLYKSFGGIVDLPETLLEDLRICPTVRLHQKSTVQTLPSGTIPDQVVYDV